jgi:thiol:disulfide interchange protein DsbA
MNKRYRITGTPTIVVAGKYVTDVGMAGGEDELFKIVNALAAREKPAG